VHGLKLAALNNVYVLKLKRGKSNESDFFLAFVITGYGYNSLSMLSASVRVFTVGSGAMS
jgi:hypothetical protein